MPVKPIPDGYRTVTPYLIARDTLRLIAFLESAFGAEVLFKSATPDGTVMHAELRIGDSMVMMGLANDAHPPVPCVLYLYVPDVDASYKKAMGAGGISIYEPRNQFYGDRNGGVKDAEGNQWFIGTHVEDVAPDELERRARAAHAPK